MIGKITKGKSFNSLIHYILDDRKEAQLLDHQGVLAITNQDIAKSFNLQSRLNPKLKVRVGHISLNFHKNDLYQLSNDKMVQIAHEYLQAMGIQDTQYIIGRHFDKEHPHIHICYNRVNNQGQTISDQFDKQRNAEITKELTLKYNLYYAKGKENVKTHRLTEPYKAKYEIHFAIGHALQESNTWDELIEKLKKQGITTEFKYKLGNGADIQGISFTKGDYTFSGSKIDRSFSYSKLSNCLSPNISENLITSEETERNRSTIYSSTSVVHSKQYYESDDETEIKKKKKNRKSNNRGLTL